MARLRAANLRPTSARLLVLLAIDRAAVPVSADSLFLSLGSAGTPVPVATAYRALTDLTSAGLLQRTWVQSNGGGKAVYSAVQPWDEQAASMHRLVCECCGLSVAFVDTDLAQRVSQAANLPALAALGHGLSIQVGCLGSQSGCLLGGGTPVTEARAA